MGRHVLRFLVLSLGLSSGCDDVFDLNRPPLPGLENYDRCGPFLADEPLRYATISSQQETPMPWSWDDARAACKRRGMDLAVLNDASELGSVAVEASWPFWIGEQVIGGQIQTVDGCPATDTPITLRTLAANATACGLVAGPVETATTSCDGALPPDSEPSFVMTALCETPRPDHDGCLGNLPTPQQYVISGEPMTYAAANSFCGAKDGHLVVVETSKEWLFLSAQTSEKWQHAFWLGSTYRGDTWESVTGCPATFSWTGNNPGSPTDGSCVSAKTREVTGQEDGLNGVYLDGAEITACDDTSYALCEID